MTERKTVGVKVDADLWAEFRQDVKERKGQTRGVLGDELEKALRQYLYTQEKDDLVDNLRDIDERTARLESKLEAAIEAADGGVPPTDLPDADEHTHTDDRPDQSKPGANGPRPRKVDWLVQQVREGRDTQTCHRDDILRDIVDAYGFTGNTADWYADRIIDELGAEPIPQNDDVLGWGDGLDEMREAHRQQAEDDVDREAERLDQAERRSD